MSTEKVIGCKVLVEANIGTPESPDYEIVAGQRDAAVNLTADVVDTTSKDGDGWKSNKVSFLDWDADLDGVIVETNAGLAALEIAFNTGAAVLIRMIFPDGTKKIGTANITSMPIKVPMAGEASYTLKLKGTGKLLTETGYTNAPVISYPTNGGTSYPINNIGTMSAAAFTDGTDTWGASRIQVTPATDPLFAAPVIDITSPTPSCETSIYLLKDTLEQDTVYLIRAKHRGNKYGWGAWSAVNSFTTESGS